MATGQRRLRFHDSGTEAAWSEDMIDIDLNHSNVTFNGERYRNFPVRFSMSRWKTFKLGVFLMIGSFIPGISSFKL